MKVKAKYGFHMATILLPYILHKNYLTKFILFSKPYQYMSTKFENPT